MENFEEIIKSIDRSEIFVFFISDNSLESEWVQSELVEARTRLENGNIKRFFPIIIDTSINYTDSRIPEWMKESYNLRPITKPTTAARRIREKLIEASWENHPVLKDRQKLFVGRNTQIQKFEERFDDFTKNQPSVVIASGLHEVGRKTTIKHALKKSSITRDTYEPYRIDLNRYDNIEGLILKLRDLGITETSLNANLIKEPLKAKIEICAKIIKEISDQKEVIILNDNYCIVRYEGDIAPWFKETLDLLPVNRFIIAVACSARPNTALYRRDDRYFFLQIPELEKQERTGLLKRYTEVLGVDLKKDDFEKFTPLLKGLPEQVTYAATMIAELGTHNAFNNAHEISNFSTYRANIVIDKIKDRNDLIEFLRFISSFEFISIDFLYQIEQHVKHNLTALMNELLAFNICENWGPDNNYYRINDVIRDAIIRDRFYISEQYKSALRHFVQEFVVSWNINDFDISEYQIAAREALSQGLEIPESILIPAHFLQTMQRLYDDRRYKDVIVLADQILQNKENYDSHTEQDIRYYLCQSLARESDPRFLDEVQFISGPEHDFLFGFYYRTKRNFDKALERYNKAKNYKRTEQRSMREIVAVLVTIEDYSSALSIARENSEKYPGNTHLAQAYFNCLINSDDKVSVKPECENILDQLQRIGGNRAEEMLASAKSRFEFEYGDKSVAIEMINDAISKYSNIIYPLLTKLDLAMALEDKVLIQDTLDSLRRRHLNAGHKANLLKGEAMLHALSGDVDRSLRMLDKELSRLSNIAKSKLETKFRKIAARS